MLIYPSRESKTRLTSQPFFCLLLCLLSLVCYVSIYQPAMGGYLESEVALKKDLLSALEWDLDQGNITREMLQMVQANPAVLKGDPEFWAALSANSKHRYEVYAENQMPFREPEPGLGLALSLIMPAGPWVFLLSAIFLWLAGFVFEHVYRGGVVLVIFLCSGAAMMWVGQFLPEQMHAFWPHPVFAWPHFVAIMVCLAWALAPRGFITLTVRGWFLRPFLTGIRVPTVVLLLMYFVLLAPTIRFLTPFGPWFHLQSWVGLVVLTLICALILFFLPTRRTTDLGDPKHSVDGALAKAELLLAKEKREEARAVLESLVSEKIEQDQVMRVGDLAWQSDFGDLAERCYGIILRKVIPTRDLDSILEVLERAVYRHFDIPFSSLASTVELALKNDKLNRVKRLLPYLKDHPRADNQGLYRIFELLVDSALSKAEVDEALLLQIMRWFPEDSPLAPVAKKAASFFQQRADRDESWIEKGPTTRISRFVRIQLQEISGNYIQLTVDGSGKSQNVPWTAILALFGGRVLEPEPAYFGSIVIRFQRKIFACVFDRSRIALRDVSGLDFEEVWERIRRHTPEDVPFVAFENFRDCASASDFNGHVQAFLTEMIGM